jgi:hypothetical protein
MSTELREGRILVTRYGGPANQEGGRLRYQVTIPEAYFSVSESELEELMLELAAILDIFAEEAKLHEVRP